MKSINNYLLIGLTVTTGIFSGCGDDDVPPAENEEEIINSVTLTFSPVGGGSDVVATYLDPDGEGTEDPTLTNIELSTGTSYSLSITMANTLETPAEDITEEVEEEGDEHQIFFQWTDDIFSDPTGRGNINATGTVNYADEDADGNPIGLSTTWTTVNQSLSGGEFRILLKHQPDIKSSSSSSSDGETDIDITWTLNVSE